MIHVDSPWEMFGDICRNSLGMSPIVDLGAGVQKSAERQKTHDSCDS
jgi:hypothetical protein